MGDRIEPPYIISSTTVFFELFNHRERREHREGEERGISNNVQGDMGDRIEPPYIISSTTVFFELFNHRERREHREGEERG
ncbi:hypothetical protein, partial [Microcoleus sp. CAWBG27]|uniref:hypothetical protein n=1 Tax=Microcoleus sp. CAWBG27 TaxID=2841645 RepID=UPI0025ED36C1